MTRSVGGASPGKSISGRVGWVLTGCLSSEGVVLGRCAAGWPARGQYAARMSTTKTRVSVPEIFGGLPASP